jgi:hypothetical protein
VNSVLLKHFFIEESPLSFGRLSRTYSADSLISPHLPTRYQVNIKVDTPELHVSGLGAKENHLETSRFPRSSHQKAIALVSSGVGPSHQEFVHSYMAASKWIVQGRGGGSMA